MTVITDPDPALVPTVRVRVNGTWRHDYSSSVHVKKNGVWENVTPGNVFPGYWAKVNGEWYGVLSY